MLAVAEQSLALLPLVLLPMFAVRDALRTAEDAEEHRVEAAEQAAEEARTVAADKARLAEVEHTLVERLRESDRLKDDLLAPSPTSCAPRWPGCWAPSPP